MRGRAQARGFFAGDAMVTKLFSICAAGLLVSGCFKEQPRNDAAASAKQIQQLFDHWAKAFEAKDVNGVMAMYAPGAALTAYDIVPPLQFKGGDAYRKDYADFFAQFDGPIQVELADDHIVAGSDTAFAYGLERLTGKLTNGKPVDMWLRYTEGLKRIDGQWRVVHEHISVPIDMATGKARMDLKP
jgi:ketosteroid isomerase-like protein